VPHAFILVFDVRCSGDFGASVQDGNGLQALQSLELVDSATSPSLRFGMESGGPFENRETVPPQTALQLYATMLEFVGGAACDLCRC
jgi:hypothetical protein